MKSFLQYLREQNTEAAAWHDIVAHEQARIRSTDAKAEQIRVRSSDHPHFVSTTYTYHDKTTGVRSYIHTRDDTAYWGFTVPGNDGKETDVAPLNVDPDLRRARLDTAFEHLADFAKRNPNIENISYQTNEGERGDKNHEIFQAKWPTYQEKHGISTNLVRTENRPFE